MECTMNYTMSSRWRPVFLIITSALYSVLSAAGTGNQPAKIAIAIQLLGFKTR